MKKIFKDIITTEDVVKKGIDKSLFKNEYKIIYSKNLEADVFIVKATADFKKENFISLLNEIEQDKGIVYIEYQNINPLYIEKEKSWYTFFTANGNTNHDCNGGPDPLMGDVQYASPERRKLPHEGFAWTKKFPRKIFQKEVFSLAKKEVIKEAKAKGLNIQECILKLNKDDFTSFKEEDINLLDIINKCLEQ